MLVHGSILSSLYGLLLLFSLVGISCEGEAPCEAEMPIPVLEFHGIEELEENGEKRTYYKLAVKNFFEYSNEVFANGRIQTSILDQGGQLLRSNWINL